MGSSGDLVASRGGLAAFGNRMLVRRVVVEDIVTRGAFPNEAGQVADRPAYLTVGLVPITLLTDVLDEFVTATAQDHSVVDHLPPIPMIACRSQNGTTRPPDPSLIAQPRPAMTRIVEDPGMSSQPQKDEAEARGRLDAAQMHFASDALTITFIEPEELDACEAGCVDQRSALKRPYTLDGCSVGPTSARTSSLTPAFACTALCATVQ
jgi:hypothetical protein